MKSSEDRIGTYPHLLRPASFRSSDGSTLQYFDSEAGKPLLLLANGLGGPCASFAPLAEALHRDFRLVSWDYRGLYGSSQALKTDLSVEKHARDARELLEHLGDTEAYFLGWSMGVQVGLELARHEAALKGLILVSGTAGSPLRSFPLPMSERLHHFFPYLGRSGAAFRAILSDRGLGKRGLWLAKRLRLVGENFKQEHFNEMRREFSGIDFTTYFDLLREVCAHDARATAALINTPSLILTGDADHVTPPSAGKELASLLRRGEHVTLRGATHYAAVEYPREIADLILDFCGKFAADQLT